MYTHSNVIITYALILTATRVITRHGSRMKIMMMLTDLRMMVMVSAEVCNVMAMM